MRIDSTDATNVSVQAVSTTEKNTQSGVTTSSSTTGIGEERQTHYSEYEKRELPISEKAVLNAVEKANKAVSMSGRTFEYSIHEKTKEIMIKVIDSDTKKVIREIPPEKILDMVANMMEMAGLLVDERR
jgi:Uncharacterized flagellar protein FlaG